jgi:PAS domain-containing protein
MAAESTPENCEIETLQKKVSGLEGENRALRKENRRLLLREAVLHATLDATTDGVLAVDEKGNIVFSNRRFLKMWRIPPDLLETENDDELLEFALGQLEDPEAFLARVRELYTSVEEDHDIIRFRDGRVFERYSQPLVHADEVHGRVWSFRDITSP